ncbi:MAG: flagellar hook-associated protein 3 [Betaproteobacteria bacterium]|nr:flagellar hook-associated protein 3 [Betaproteobacteria bacterium]
MRIGTDTSQRALVGTLHSRQSDLADLQQQVSTGRRVLRASDDPAAISRAERARNALQRMDADQRALASQRATLAQAESTLGQSVDVLQNVRELMLQASNGSLSTSDRQSIAQQVLSLRDHLLALANQRDANGLALFGGPGCTVAPFAVTSQGLVYQGVPAQAAPTESSVPASMDGQRLWMNLPDGNGVFRVESGSANSGTVWADPGTVTDPSALDGHSYEIRFAVTASGAGGNTTTWTAFDTTTGQALGAAQPYAEGMTLKLPGMSVVARGAPAQGDTLQIGPSGRGDLFAVLQRAADAIRTGGPALGGAVSRATRELDTGLDRLMMGRTLAGEWLRRADTIDNLMQDRRLDVERLRADAEDIDMVRSVSELQGAQTNLDVALKTYAQIQRLSLFNYLG